MTPGRNILSMLRVLGQGLAWAVLFLVVMLFTVEALDRAFLRPYGNYARSMRKFLQQRDQVEILYMGQSDMGDGILDDLLATNEFNFAWGGETLIGTYHKLKYHVDHMPRLKMVVLALPLCSFTSARSNQLRVEHYIFHIHDRDLWNLYRLKGPVVLGQEAVSWVSFFENRTLGTLPFRIQKARKAWVEQREEKRDKQDKKKDKDSRKPKTKTGRPVEPWDVEKETQQVIRSHWLQRNPFDADLMFYFKKLLQLAAEKKVKVILLTCPVSGRYLELAAPYISMDALKQRVLEQPDVRPLIYRHLNYLDLFAERIECFKNPDHLAREGAANFTGRVRQDLADLRRLPTGGEHNLPSLP